MQPNPLAKSQGLPGPGSSQSKVAQPQQLASNTKSQVVNVPAGVSAGSQASKAIKKQLTFEGSDREKRNQNVLSNVLI